MKIKEKIKFNEALGILLMLIGITMIADFSADVIGFKMIIPPIISVLGVFYYAFSERMSKIR